MTQQTAKQAVQAIDQRKAEATRPTVQGRGKGTGAMGSITFDKVPNGFKVANQVALVIDAYFDLIAENGGNHQMVSISDINDKADLLGLGYDQDATQIIGHYKPSIEGSTSWLYKQGKIRIGSFK